VKTPIFINFEFKYHCFQKGYEELQCIVPTCQNSDSVGSQKLSKATVLQRCE